jgi:hypothetical protein
MRSFEYGVLLPETAIRGLAKILACNNIMFISLTSLIKGKGKIVPVLLSTTPLRHIGEWSYNFTHSLT